MEEMTASECRLAQVTKLGLSGLGSNESLAIFTSKARALAELGAPVSWLMKQREETQSGGLCKMQGPAGRWGDADFELSRVTQKPPLCCHASLAPRLGPCVTLALSSGWFLVPVCPQHGELYTGAPFPGASWGCLLC